VVSGCVVAENCSNGLDDDDDTRIDCLDNECISLPSCVTSCASPQAVLIPTFETKSTIGRPDSYQPSCASGTGSEYVYEVTAPASGPLGIAVRQAYGNFTLSVLATCGEVATELGCSSAVDNPSFAESLQVDVEMGTTYFVVVDAASAATSGEFDIQMAMISGGEGVCTDLFDGDADSLVDCNDPDCQATSVCTDGTGGLGTSCGGTAECASMDDDPICLPSDLGFDAGYCSEFCSLANDDCPGDGHCYDYGIGADGICLDGCTDGGDCRSGYACVDLGLASKVCYIPPESDCENYEDDDFDQLTDCDDPDCKATQTCVPGTEPYGEPCTSHNQCASHAGSDPLCLSSPLIYPNGYCSEFCNVAQSDCGPGGLCFDLYFLDGASGQCFRRCQTDNDCAAGTSCVDAGFGKHCNG
jgi:hypothetical protein